MTKKYVAWAMVLTTLLLLIPSFVLAYSRVPNKSFGWSIYRLTNREDVLNTSKRIGGLDNSGSMVSAPYSFQRTVSQSWTKGGSLSSSISGSGSGLGAQIAASVQWSFSQSYSETQTYGPVTVTPKTRLDLYGDFYGNRTTGLAKYFIAWLVVSKKGDYEVRSMEAMVIRPKWTYYGPVQPYGSEQPLGSTDN